MAKEIAFKLRLPYKLYLLLLSPLFIMFIFMKPHTPSVWEKEDSFIEQRSPLNQGWTQVVFKEEVIKDSEEEPLED
jgi:hypothetical protein